MLEVLIDTLLDLLKLIPFLFVVFLIMEYFEHKVSKKNKNLVIKAGKLGPIVGGFLGAFPQCGFSVAITNLFSARIISLGTLVAVYLSTSDEMLPILISEGADISLIIAILLFKVIIGMVCGLIIDLFVKRKENEGNIKELCEHEHCHCDESLLWSSIVHTFRIVLFIFIATFVLNTIIYFIGESNLEKLFLNNTILGPFISSLIGLIPNCASSVIITELYLNGALTFGSTMAGLLTGSGIGILILFKTNKNLKENLFVVSLVYGIGVLVGIITNLVL